MDDGEARGPAALPAGAPGWAAGLGLSPHPEGGWFAETYRSAGSVAGPHGERALATAILFLLLPGEASAWHRVASDELWFHHRGGPLELSLGGTDGSGPTTGAPGPVRVVLGGDASAATDRAVVGVPQALVPAGTWQCARPLGAEAVLAAAWSPPASTTPTSPCSTTPTHAAGLSSRR